MTLNDAAEDKLMSYGVEYYVAARSSALAHLSIASGGLFHHAIEYLLKSRIALTLSLDDIRRQYGHDLPRLWNRFKREFPASNLGEFDSFIDLMHEFEEIRYPDEIIKSGAALFLDFGESQSGRRPGETSNGVPAYRLSVRDADRLVITIFDLCSRNPQFYCGRIYSEHGVGALTTFNKFASRWAAWCKDDPN